jgi:hypothetical protein
MMAFFVFAGSSFASSERLTVVDGLFTAAAFLGFDLGDAFGVAFAAALGTALAAAFAAGLAAGFAAGFAFVLGTNFGFAFGAALGAVFVLTAVIFAFAGAALADFLALCFFSAVFFAIQSPLPGIINYSGTL